jgi:hypothetical protein
MSRMTRPRGPLWPRALDLGATHPLLGAVVGLALVAVLVPVLYVFRGEDPRQTIYPSQGLELSPQRALQRARVFLQTVQPQGGGAP